MDPRQAVWLAALLATSVQALPVDDPAAPVVTIGAPTAAPTIDGRFEPAEWANAVPVAGLAPTGSREVMADAPDVRVQRDAQHLYLAVRVTLPGRPPVARATTRDGAVWEDDAVELFLDPGHSQRDYYQLIVNAAGTCYDGRTKQASWNGAWTAKAAKLADGWSVELAVPFATVGAAPADGALWGLNVCVGRPGLRALSWAPVAGGFHEPERFGHLRFTADCAAGVQSLAGLVSGDGPVAVAVRGAGVTARGVLTCDGATVSDQPVTDSFAVKLPREGRFTKAGRYRLSLTARRPGDAVPVLALIAERQVKPPLALKVQAYVTSGKLVAAAEIEPGGLSAKRLSCRFEIAQGATRRGQAVAWTGKSPLTATFAKADVPAGKITLTATLLEGDQVVTTEQRDLDRPLDPPWLGDRTGLTDRVPAPWTAVKVAGRQVRPWGRVYDFGGGVLPASVESAGAQMLAGPVTLALSRGGRRVAWTRSTAKVASARPNEVKLTGGAEAPGLTLSGTTTIEYDGMIRCDLVLTGDAGAPDTMVLEVPLKAEHARYLYHFPGAWQTVANAAALPAEGWRHGFKPYVWLGDEDRGLSWFCESEENWSPAEAKAAITVERETGRTVLRLHLVEGTALSGERRYTFGFQATPVKQPEKTVWDYRIHHGGSYTLHTSPFVTTGRVVYPAAGQLDPQRGTFECWLQPRFDSDPTRSDDEKRKMGNRMVLTLDLPEGNNAGIYWNELHQGPVVWVRERGEVKFYAGASVTWKTGEWHHLAFSWGDRIRAWADGKLLFERPFNGFVSLPLADGTLTLGDKNSPFVIDEVRIVDETREPAVPTGPLTADEHTLLLDSFDSWTGPTTSPTRGAAGTVGGSALAVEGRWGRAVQLGSEATGGYTLLDRLADRGVRTVCFHEHWTPYQSYPGTTPEYEPKLDELVTAVHGQKMQLLLYMSRQIADIAPEYELYSGDILTLPRTFMYHRQPTQIDYGVCWRSHWKEFCLKNLAAVMDRFGTDGWYLDGPEWSCPCTNREHGCGYLKPDGSVGPTWDIFATRDFMRRLYILTRERQPSGQLNIHNSTVMLIPTLGWGTSSWDGEQLGGIERAGTEFGKLLPLDAFRCEMMGRQWGVPAEFLCYERPWNSHEALSFTLLHDVLVRPNDYGQHLEEISTLWRIADEFGRSRARWLPYWSNGDAVRTDSSVVKASLYTRGRDGCLVIVSNLSTEPRGAGLTLSLAKLGLPAGAKARNAVTGAEVRLTGGSLTVPLQGFDYAVLLIR